MKHLRKADALPESWNGSFCGFAQEGLELCEQPLDGIEVRRIRGKQEQPGAHPFDQLPDLAALMGRKVVHDHHIAVRQGARQHLLDIGLEGFTVHGAVEQEGSAEFADPETCHEGGGLPMTPRLLADDTLPLGSAAIKADHFGVGSGLIHKHQLARIEAGLLGLPALTRLSDVGSILFGRVQNFF